MGKKFFDPDPGPAQAGQLGAVRRADLKNWFSEKTSKHPCVIYRWKAHTKCDRLAKKSCKNINLVRTTAILVFYDVIMTSCMTLSQSDVINKDIVKTYSYQTSKHFYLIGSPLHNLNKNYRGRVNVTLPSPVKLQKPSLNRVKDALPLLSKNQILTILIIRFQLLFYHFLPLFYPDLFTWKKRTNKF